MKEVHPLAIIVIVSENSTNRRFGYSLTYFLEDGALLIKDHMEIPASSQAADWRFRTVALSTDDPNLHWALRTFWVCGNNLIRTQFLVRRLDHLVLQNIYM